MNEKMNKQSFKYFRLAGNVTEQKRHKICSEEIRTRVLIQQISVTLK